MLSSKQKELIIGLVFLCLSVAAFAYTYTFVNRVTTDVGPAYMPRIICGIMALLGAIKIIVALRMPNTAGQEREAAAAKSEKEKGDFKAGMLTIAAIGAYTLLFRIVGFIPCTMAYIFVQSTIFDTNGKKTLPVRIGLSMVLPIALYYLFVYGFNLMLPTGTLW